MMGRIFAFGDIHGHLTKLESLLNCIPFNPTEDELIFLGDYIDRGPHSKEVVERLIALQESGAKTVFLRGNHEEMLLAEYLTGRFPELYHLNGGGATLRSYGLEQIPPTQARLPARHKAFFDSLLLYHRQEGYIFVHAGLKPGPPLEEQSAHDLLWIREEFFLREYDWPETIVFGHTPFAQPFLQGRMIGIDTGAAYGGRLTCLVLPEAEFIQS